MKKTATFSLISPLEIILTILKDDFNPLTNEYFSGLNSSGFLVSQILDLPQERMNGFKSMHKIDIEWIANFHDSNKVQFAKCTITLSCILQYIHTENILDKFVNMMRVSHEWAKLEFETNKAGTIVESLEFPYFQVDLKKVSETTDLLLESDKP